MLHRVPDDFIINNGIVTGVCITSLVYNLAGMVNIRKPEDEK